MTNLGVFAKVFQAMKEQKARKDGVIEETLPNATFRVRMEDGSLLLGHLSGRMRMNHIRISLGDKVAIEVGPDGRRGRIVLRK